MNLNYITEEDAVKSADAVKTTTASAEDIANPDKKTDVGKRPQVTADDLYSKLLKFIPAPLLGIYLMATNVIVGMTNLGQQLIEALLLGVLVFFVIATIVFLKVRKVRTGQVWMSATAFIVFAAGSPGWFTYLNWWQPAFATLALIAVAVVIVVFKPTAALPQD